MRTLTNEKTCVKCDDVMEVQGFTCPICGEEFCEDCRVSCDCCGENFCKSCIVSLDVEPIVCPDCMHLVFCELPETHERIDQIITFLSENKQLIAKKLCRSGYKNITFMLHKGRNAAEIDAYLYDTFTNRQPDVRIPIQIEDGKLQFQWNKRKER